MAAGDDTHRSPGDLDATTLPPATGMDALGLDRGREVTGLVVLWSREEPHRIGEAVLLPAGDRGPWTFGRGETRRDASAGRLSLVQHRPGELTPTRPLECPRISRNQFRLGMTLDGALEVENVGSCAMLHDGHEASRVELAPGHMIALRNEMLFLCVRRTLFAPPPDEILSLPLHGFGEPDAFGIIGESQAVWDLRFRVLAIARQRFHTLILGESGCGKEMVAQAIHAQSARGGRPIVSRNAATIPEGLADAELFGTARNYPNAGAAERPGLVGQADGSTLFLDEFAELSPEVQARLLRLMDEGEYHRLGEAMARRSDLRILAATNRPASQIKHDVLARLKVRLSVPDLNVRREDIPLLVVHRLRQHAKSDPLIAKRFFQGGDLRNTPFVSPILIEALVKHRYTTHVRELDALLIQSALEGGQGHYLEPSAELTRELSSRAAPPVPTDERLAGLSSAEQLRLTLLRRHRFSPTRCGHDPAYPGNRQTADFHLRHLVCRGLQNLGLEHRARRRLSGWDRRRARARQGRRSDRDVLVEPPGAPRRESESDVTRCAGRRVEGQRRGRPAARRSVAGRQGLGPIRRSRTRPRNRLSPSRGNLPSETAGPDLWARP